MSADVGTRSGTRNLGVSLAGLRFAVFTTRNLVFLIAVLAMNYTLMRPSPVDLLFIASFLITLFHLTLFKKQEVTRRSVVLTLLFGAWAVSYFIASLPYLGEQFVGFELLAKTFAISIGIIGAFVSMSWNRRHFETFMKVYILSCVVASILGTIGFLLQMELLTWDGRAKGLIDDPNMYGSFLIPAVVFCAYFLSRSQGSKVLLIGALAVVLLGILLSFSRIAVVAALLCLFAYIFFHNRRRPRRLLLIFGGLVAIGIVLFGLASVTSADFTEILLDRLTFAKSYDLGEEGRYARYLLVLPMIIENPIGVGVLQLEKIFPEPIHNIWLSSFVNYGWGGGIAWVILAFGSVVVSIRNYRRTQSEIAIALLISLVGIVMGATLHEGEHWRHMWLLFGLVWGLNSFNLGLGTRSTAASQDLARKRSPPRWVSATTAAQSHIGARAPEDAGRKVLRRVRAKPAVSGDRAMHSS
jgi:hypothetical protein